MTEREIDGFKVWASASKFGDEPVVAYVEIKSIDGSDLYRRFQLATPSRFATLEQAQDASSTVVNAIETISPAGEPEPFGFEEGWLSDELSMPKPYSE